MMKRQMILLCVTLAASAVLATAQNSKPKASPSKSSAHNATSSTKPLTPKSAMTPAHKTSLTVPNASNSRKTNAELTRLERQNVKAGTPKGSSGGTAPKVPAIKSDTKPSANGSGINASYQKPHVPNK
jgi:hypothetical protein